MEKVLVNPTLEQVNAELAALCRIANKGQRTRTADMSVTEGEWAADRCMYRAGGDGVSNSYGSRASTTVVGCCWVTLNGARVVRLEASRTSAIASPHGRRDKLPFGFSGAITRWEKADERDVVRAGVWGLATAELAPAVPAFIGTSGPIGQCHFPTTDCRLPVVADWLDDQNLPTTHLRLWLALGEPAGQPVTA